jgi:hypothetical protein
MKVETCPRCGSDRVAEIVYGFTSAPPEDGSWVPDGCVIDVDNPDRHCRECGAAWLAAVTEPS